MSFPGEDILIDALTLIDPQTLIYKRATGRTTNSLGQYITTYADPVNILGSWQPLPKSLYEQFGLSLQKSYFLFFVSTDLLDIERDESADQLIFNNKLYQCESAKSDWFEIDGWTAMLCCFVERIIA